MSKEKTNIEKKGKGSRVSRGGGWINLAQSLRVSYRYLSAQAATGSNLGFRLVLQTKEKK